MSERPDPAATVELRFDRLPPARMLAEASAFQRRMANRRSVRTFASDPLPDGLIESCLLAAGSAPSGANKQPWHFAVVRDPAVKRRIRHAAEAEERAFYDSRASQDWLDDLAPLGTDADKPFLEQAPCLIAVFAQRHGGTDDAGRRNRHYYVTESVGLATGLLIAALHQAGVATLTHTPSPMKFLNEILERPPRERPFVLLVAGYPAPDARVPDIRRKTLAEIARFF